MLQDDYDLSKSKKCLICDKTFMVKPSRWEKKCCSKKCSMKYFSMQGYSKESIKKLVEFDDNITREERTCKQCQKTFIVAAWRREKYCSRRCAGVASNKTPRKIWNKGLSMDNPRLRESVEKATATKKRKYEAGELHAWNKGLTAKTDERMAKMVETQTIWRNTEGPEKEAWKKALAKGQVKAWSQGSYNHIFTNTKPEQQTAEYLRSLGYTVKEFADKKEDDPPNTWYHQFNFQDTFVPDFACPDLKSIIEVNGCAVHGHKRSECIGPLTEWKVAAEMNKPRDSRKYNFYHRSGWKWAIVWQCEVERGLFSRLYRYLGIA